MTRRTEVVARLEHSRQRLQLAMAGQPRGSAAGALLLHVVRRHPWASAAAAAALGALLARLRPWRWLQRPELWQTLLPGLLAALAGAPASSWSALVAAFMQDLAAGPAPPDGSAPGQPGA